MRFDKTPFGVEEVEELTSEKMRILAFLYIPDDASFDEAMGWLVSQLNGPMSRANRHAVCTLHLRDNTLRRWRADRRDSRSLRENLANQDLLT